MVVRLVWDQEAAGSNPVSPTFINTGTMKKFSQFINSINEELSFGMPMNLRAFAKGAAIGALKKVGGAMAKTAGVSDIIAAGKEGDIEASKVVDAKLNCKEKALALKRQLTSAIRTSNIAAKRCQTTGDPDDCDDDTRYKEIVTDLQDEIKHHDAECGKIQSSRSMHDVEKARLRGSQERLSALGGKP